MRKKIISFVLILTMLGMFVPMEAFASPQTHPNTYTNTGDQRADIIGVAKTQLGYTEGSNKDTKYGDWFGKPHQNWCAMFVSWCAWQANIPESILRPSAGAGHSENYFNIPYYDGNNYTPKPGDLFFTKKTSTTEEWGHVGLVYYIDGSDGNYFYSIEGNSRGGTSTYAVRKNRWKKSNCYFGVPNYQVNTVKPGKINDLSVSVGDGGKCTFRWSGVSNVQKYVVKIWKDKLWEGDSTYESDASSGHVAQLRAGSYIAYVDAVNGSEYVMSNTVSFTVNAINVKKYI